MSLLNIRDLSYWSNSSLSSVNSAYFTFCFSSVSTDILKLGWNNLSSTNLFLCSPVSPEVGKSSASECEYDRRDCDQLQMVEDKLQYSLPRQQPVRAFRLSPASKLHTRRAVFPKKIHWNHQLWQAQPACLHSAGGAASEVVTPTDWKHRSARPALWLPVKTWSCGAEEVAEQTVIQHRSLWAPSASLPGRAA